MDSGPVRAGRDEPPQFGGGRGDRREGVSGWRRRPVSSDRADAICYATYTAFDGSQVAPHLLETSNFRTFTISQLSGPPARNKGMALFPAGSPAAMPRSPAGTEKQHRRIL